MQVVVVPSKKVDAMDSHIIEQDPPDVSVCQQGLHQQLRSF